jgi:hypothetical protein
MVCGCMVFDHVSQSVCVIAYGTMDPMRTRRLGVVKTKMAIRKIAEATLHCNLRLSRALVAFCLICLLRGLSFLCVCWSLSLFLFLFLFLSIYLRATKAGYWDWGPTFDGWRCIEVKI